MLGSNPSAVRPLPPNGQCREGCPFLPPQTRSKKSTWATSPHLATGEVSSSVPPGPSRCGASIESSHSKPASAAAARRAQKPRPYPPATFFPYLLRNRATNRQKRPKLDQCAARGAENVSQVLVPPTGKDYTRRPVQRPSFGCWSPFPATSPSPSPRNALDGL